MPSIKRSMDWRHRVWFALLVAASLGLSTTFACATPLVAFGVTAALTLPSRDALKLIGVIWFTDQVFGYTVLDYPRTLTSVAWGLIMGAAAVLATIVAQGVIRHVGTRPKPVTALAAFLVGFSVYQATLLAPALLGLGGLGGFTPAIIGRVLVINISTLVSLTAIHYVVRPVGSAAQSEMPIPGTRRPA